MLVGRQDVVLDGMRIGCALRWDKAPDPLAGHRLERHGADGVAEEGDGVARRRVGLAVYGAGLEDDAVDGAPKQAVGPVAQQIADVDKHGRRRVRLGAGRADGDGGPGAAARQDLEAGLAAQAEEEGDAAVVGVGAGADVEGPVGGGGGVGRVVEEAEGGAGGALVGRVGGGEEVGRADVEAQAEEVEDAGAEALAGGPEGGDVCVAAGDGCGDGMGVFPVYYLA